MSESTDKNLDYEAEGASVVDVHDAVRREKVLPPAGREPLSFGPFILMLVVAAFGAGNFVSLSEGFSGDIYSTRFYSPDPRPPGAGGPVVTEQLAWIDQWMKDGRKVYDNCKTCHQDSGLGQPGQFPPLKNSEWVNGGTKRIAAIVLKGVGGPFTVNGQGYNGNMAEWGPLGDEKIAQVITYVRRQFGTLKEGDDGIVTTEMVKAAREEFSGRTGVWDEAGLRAIPEHDMLPGAKVDPLTGQPAAP